VGPPRDQLVGLGVVEREVAGFRTHGARGAERDRVVALAHFLVQEEERRIFERQKGVLSP
jgi:hypothetical protein